MSGLPVRFSGVGRVYGVAGFKRLQRSHVCVMGIGGVGSWAVEALVRSGVGKLSLVDLDDVCESNINRQVHALDSSVGRAKISVMAERVKEINPECEVHTISKFFTSKTADEILSERYDIVLDAFDNARNKCLLIAKCRELKIPCVTVGGAGGRKDPTRIEVVDLTKSYNDRLLQSVRKRLRDDYGFPRQTRRRFKVDCVFSPEDVVYPQSDGTVCGERDPDSELKLDCESGFGTTCFVTGTFGFVAASTIVQKLVE